MVPSIGVMPREGSFALAFFWQDKKGPAPNAFGVALGRPQEFRFETDRCGFRHLPCITRRNGKRFGVGL